MGQGVAYMAEVRGVPCSVVVPDQVLDFNGLRCGSDEWAARALGIEPCDDDGSGGGGPIVRYEYDWERGVWQEA